MTEQVKKYIASHWDDCIHVNTKDQGTLIGMPYPYTVPAVGFFDEMYYWDTYFTNKGLELDGRYKQAKFNTDNMLYLVNRYGFMPNGNRTYYLNRSQPPFLSQMVRDVYEHSKDRSWLWEAYNTLKKEYQFWTTKRNTPVGLSQYDCLIEECEEQKVAQTFIQRIGLKPDYPTAQLARHFFTTAESGWDINPRWGMEGYHYAPVDLNSLMFMFEKNMAFFAAELDVHENEKWDMLAEQRKAVMLHLMEDERGILMDYNFVSGKRGEVFSVASFYPLFTGLADKRHAEALVKNLPLLEAEYGLATCEKNDAQGSYQWDYPNGWACLQYIAMIGLDRYGYCEEAARIANKFVQLVERVFAETGNLWEKYNVIDGSINVANEYGLPPMMGWSAGVYLSSLAYIQGE